MTKSAKSPGGITDAIIFVSRANIRPILRQELKSFGVANILNCEVVKACADALLQNDRAMLVLDYEHGPEIVNAVLRKARGLFHIDTRPIFLISTQAKQEIVAIGAEYGVSRIHTGEISKQTLSKNLKAIIAEETAVTGMRSDLIKVAEARSQGDWALAGKFLSDLHERVPDDRRITCELANNFMHEERWTEAQTILQQISQVDGHNLRAMHLLARCHMKQGRFENASEILRQTKLINPFHVDRLIDFGQVLLRLDLVKDALSNFDEALAIDDTNADARVGKGQCLLMDGDVNEALAFLREMSNPRELAAAFNNAAILSIHHGRYEQGLSLYQTAIGAIGRHDQMRSRLIFNLGLAYLKSDRLHEALDNFTKALAVDPGFNKAQHNADILTLRLQKTAQSLSIDSVPAQAVINEFSDDFEDESIAS